MHALDQRISSSLT